MKRVFAKIRPELLVWARDSAGFSLAEAADRMQIEEDQLAAWESGDARPSIPQLRELAGVYKRPLSVFYLQAVPKGFQVISDFRRPLESPHKFSPELTQEIRFAQQRRELALELAEELGEPPAKFRLTLKEGDDPEKAGKQLREYLKLSPSLRFSSDSTGRQALNAWRRASEEAGVLVFQSTRVAETEASGFALAYDVMPVIVINRKDPLTRRLFSLAHELAHLALRKSGVSDLSVAMIEPAYEATDIEITCNRFAAAALMPIDQLLEEATVKLHGEKSLEWSDDEIVRLGKQFGVSREAVLLRLLSVNRTSRSFYARKRAEYAAEYERLRQRQASQPSPPMKRNMPNEALSTLGRSFVSLVLGNYNRDRLTLSEVSGYLGLRTKHVQKLQANLRGAER